MMMSIFNIIIKFKPFKYNYDKLLQQDRHVKHGNPVGQYTLS